MARASGLNASKAKAKKANAAKADSQKRKAAKVSSLALRGGRTIQVRSGDGANRETIELTSADGSLELKITMTPEGPMIHVKGGSLAVEAAQQVSVACRRFEVQASDGIRFAGGDVAVHSEGEVRIRSQGQTFMDSEILHLNCGDRTGYPPPPEMVLPEEMRQLSSAGESATNDGCGCGEHQ